MKSFTVGIFAALLLSSVSYAGGLNVVPCTVPQGKAITLKNGDRLESIELEESLVTLRLTAVNARTGQLMITEPGTCTNVLGEAVGNREGIMVNIPRIECQVEDERYLTLVQQGADCTITEIFEK